MIDLIKMILTAGLVLFLILHLPDILSFFSAVRDGKSRREKDEEKYSFKKFKKK